MAVRQFHSKVNSSIYENFNDLVEKGVYKTKREAIEDAMLLAVRQHRAKEVSDQIDAIAERMRGLPSFTEAVIESHEEVEEES